MDGEVSQSWNTCSAVKFSGSYHRFGFWSQLHFDWFFFLCPLVVDHEAAIGVRIEESLVLGNVSEEVKVFDNKVVRLPIKVNLFIASCTALR